MGGKLVDEEDKKLRLSVSLPKWLVDKLKQSDNYSQIIYKKLLEIYQKDIK